MEILLQYKEILNKEQAQTALREGRGRHYVYVLSRPCRTPFYVGKGIGDRALAHERDAINTSLKSHKLNVIRALHAAGHRIGYTLEFMESEAAALSRERFLIAQYGRYDLGHGPLTNMTDGGEGPANFSEETRQKHRDTLAGIVEDGSPRSSVNAFFLRIGIPVASVPIKPLGERRLEPLSPHPIPRQPSARQAAAIVALAIGNKAILAPGLELNRRFRLDEIEVVLENGVGRDLLKSGMLKVSSGTAGAEILKLTPLGLTETIRLIGRETLTSFGVLMPNIE